MLSFHDCLNNMLCKSHILSWWYQNPDRSLLVPGAREQDLTDLTNFKMIFKWRPLTWIRSAISIWRCLGDSFSSSFKNHRFFQIELFFNFFVKPKISLTQQCVRVTHSLNFNLNLTWTVEIKFFWFWIYHDCCQKGCKHFTFLTLKIS